MKVPKIAKALNYLEDDLISGAEEYKPLQHKRKFFQWEKWKTVAACLVIATILFGVIQPFNHSGYSNLPLTVSAAELGQEEYVFGVALPEIVYADSAKAILYDFRGIYVYSFSEKKLVGYSDFRTTGMTLIQGSNPTRVSVSENGQIVKFYNDDNKFIYYVDKNETVKVEDYEEIESIFKEYCINYLSGNDINMMEGSEITYVDRDGEYIAVMLDYNNVDESGVLKYKNLYIVKIIDSMRIEYAIFE